MKKWAYAIATDAVIFGSFYLWLAQGLDPARKFLSFILWAFAVIWVVGGLFLKDVKVPKTSGAYGFYSHLTTAGQITLCVWSGWVSLAITAFIGWALVNATVKESKEAQ